MHDAIIVGGGPSGLNAARELAQKGLNVLVLERKNEIGEHVICTGIVGQEAFREFDLAQDSVLMEIKKVKVISPFSSFLSYEHPFPFAKVVDREKFDKYLAASAESKGVKIKLRTEVLDISVNKNAVEIISQKDNKFKEKYRSQLALIATGINYNLQKKLGLGYPSDVLNGVQTELRLGGVDFTQVFIGNEIAPGAFAWLVPSDRGKVRIGLMTEGNAQECLETLIKKYFPDQILNLNKNQIQFKAIAQGLVSKTYGERVLAIGEAAGQVKTTTGGGIYFGLLCSKIASDVVAKKLREGIFSSSGLAEYEKSWKKALRKEILLGYYARKIYSKLSDFQIERMFQIAKNDGIIPLIKAKGDFDRHSELILSLMKRMPYWQIFRSQLRKSAGRKKAKN